MALVSGWGPLCIRCQIQATEKDKKASLHIRKIKPSEKLCVSCSRPLRARAGS